MKNISNYRSKKNRYIIKEIIQSKNTWRRYQITSQRKIDRYLKKLSSQQTQEEHIKLQVKEK